MSKQSLSHQRNLTFDMGELIPIMWKNVYPGDRFRHRTDLVLRLTPLLAPVLHKVDVRIHHFYVPFFQIWDDMEDFYTGGADGTSTPTAPYIDLNAATVAEGSLLDYLGIPPANYTGSGIEINALPVRAYSHIFNEYYRDLDLVTALTIDTTSGADTTTNTSVQNIAWSKDEFTACRPWPQKGTAVSIPLAGEAPVSGIGVVGAAGGASGAIMRETEGTAPVDYAGSWTDTSNVIGIEEDSSNADYPNIYADLSGATGVSIAQLRESVGLNEFMERIARHGNRYMDLLAQRGVKGDDARLGNPVYLGGGKNAIQFSEVVAQGTESGSTNLGDLAGHGVASVQSNRYVKFFKEHGLVMSMLSVRPKSVYTQAIPREFFLTTKEDYYNPELAGIGDQIITNKEVYSEHSSPDGTFGYGPRYNECRYIANSVHGGFHSDYNDWHLGRIHSGDIALNSSFINCNPSKRIFAEQTKDALKATVFHSLQAIRPMTSVGRPSRIL